MRLSVVIPAYNELGTLEAAVRAVQATGLDLEVIIVDDGSTDGTRELLSEWQTAQREMKSVLGAHLRLDNVRVVFQARNSGKGAAVRRGFGEATGDVIVVQDADLEYDPRDWFEMLRLIDEGWADVVYGSRFGARSHRVLYLHHFLGNKLISALVSLLCNVVLTDVEVGYKMFRREVLDGLQLTANDFGFEVEFTTKVARQGNWRIYETGIRYYGRTYAEGKKIGWRDGVRAIGYAFRYRFGP